MSFSVPFRVFRGLNLRDAHRSCWAKFGIFRINRSLLTISANQSSIVLVRAARRRYRLYHQQPDKSAPLNAAWCGDQIRLRLITDTLDLTTVRSLITIEGNRL